MLWSAVFLAGAMFGMLVSLVLLIPLAKLRRLGSRSQTQPFITHVESVNFQLERRRVYARLETSDGIFYLGENSVLWSAGGSQVKPKESYHHDADGKYERIMDYYKLYQDELARQERMAAILEAELKPIPERQPRTIGFATDAAPEPSTEPLPAAAQQTLQELDEHQVRQARDAQNIRPRYRVKSTPA